MQQFIVGRTGNQRFSIGNKFTRVSNEHLKITITDNGEWWIEDLNSTNGTFVQDENGEYQRISKKRIDEFTRIALGGNQIGCFVFIAHHVLEPYSENAEEESDNYCAEFQNILLKYNDISREREVLEAKVRKKTRIKMYPAIITPLIGLPIFFLGNNNMHIGITYVLTQLSTLVPFVLDRFSSEKEELARLAKVQKKVCICPHCNLELDPDEIELQCCSHCKAHA